MSGGFGPITPPSGGSGATPDLNAVLAEGGTVAASSVISLTDNAAAALSVKEAANDYLVFVTTNGSESVTIAKALKATSTAAFGSSGQTSIDASGNMTVSSGYSVSIADNVATAWEVKEGANSYIRAVSTDGAESVTISRPLKAVSTAAFGSSGQTVLDASGNMSVSSGYTVSITDNVATAWEVKEGANSYIKVVTTNAGESVTIAQPLKATSTTALGSSGQTTLDASGNASFSAGATISVVDNQTAALSFREGANDYLIFRTTNSGEQVRVTQVLASTAGFLSSNYLALNNTSVSSTSSIAASRTIVGVTSGGITLTLPPVASVNDGHVLIIKDETGAASTSNITLDGNASETIDGALTFTLNVNYQSVTLYKRNSAWWII